MKAKRFKRVNYRRKADGSFQWIKPDDRAVRDDEALSDEAVKLPPGARTLARGNGATCR